MYDFQISIKIEKVRNHRTLKTGKGLLKANKLKMFIF